MKIYGASLLLAACLSIGIVGCETALHPLSLESVTENVPTISSVTATPATMQTEIPSSSSTTKMTDNIQVSLSTDHIEENTSDAPQNVVYVQPTPSKQEEQEPLHIIFAGDAMFDWSVKDAISRNGPDYPFRHIQSDITQADFSFVNLETAVTLEDAKDTNQIYNFKSNPESLTGLKEAGFDMVSVANNHSMDFLQKGFLDTLTHLDKAGLLYVGGGLNAREAYQAKSVILKGKKVKFLAFSRFIPTGDWFAGPNKPGIAQAYDRKPVLDAITRERADADYVLVYLHWGVEMNNRPEPWQREFAKLMIDAGADAIIGSHVHVLQGFEYYKGKPIAYSIGNFLFPDYVTGPKADTGLLHLKLAEDQIQMSFQPFYIEKNQIVSKGTPYVDKQLAYLQSISYGVDLEGQHIRPHAEIASR
ncbi:CapA family protein [Paenibacillus qinlingensis]|uniref:Poly-gamma-glutamate synthesis protein (Capsule biosynthesis protein) n=1 Tax=Paenibacillus qinlingensis TaxID=1837343 RepID=A0ABU1NV01_9BACL|nr:CapA family protein [Paenibacillus qinlingensis]MDR6551308.1 poly-gamma-glutamate synthesis protein (capsule biosynthesis protein) [Paenibacillus qinlingensis]